MTESVKRRKSRHEALVEIRRRFIAKGYPRLVVATLIGLSGLAAFGFSTLLFRLGVEHMGYRYLAATAVGYGVFMLLLALWIELNRPPESVLLGAVVALFYVVYYAPLLLAEVALDAALVTGVYRKLRKQDTRNWLGSAIRHTWKPALTIAACLYVVGVVIQWAMPTARTIGDVLRS